MLQNCRARQFARELSERNKRKEIDVSIESRGNRLGNRLAIGADNPSPSENMVGLL